MKSCAADELERFYKEVSSKDGVSISRLDRKLNNIFDIRTENDKQKYREGSGNWKTVLEEIVPVRNLLQHYGIQSGRIRFLLKKQHPDAWLCRDGLTIGIEVTTALGTERVALGMKLNQSGMAPGFAGKQDGPLREHLSDSAWEMYSTEFAISAIREGIIRCFDAKNQDKFDDMILIVTAKLTALPAKRWSALVPCLSNSAAHLPFAQVYVVDHGGENQPPLHLKGSRIDHWP